MADRTCTGCGMRKPPSDFYECRPRRCKTCIRAKAARYRAEHPDRAAASLRRWYQRNSDRQRANTRAHYWADPDKARAAKATYRARHRAELSAAAVAWKRANPALAAEYNRRRRATYSLPIRLADIEAKFAYWGNACWMCRGPAEQIDHVKPVSKGGPHILANLRPICGPCNRRKSATWPLADLRRTG